MPEPDSTVLELEEIISRYTTYFIFFDIVFFALLIAGCLSKSLAEVRSMSYNLAPPDITKNDFLLLVKNLCEEFAENTMLPYGFQFLKIQTLRFFQKMKS